MVNQCCTNTVFTVFCHFYAPLENCFHNYVHELIEKDISLAILVAEGTFSFIREESFITR